MVLSILVQKITFWQHVTFGSSFNTCGKLHFLAAYCAWCSSVITLDFRQNNLTSIRWRKWSTETGQTVTATGQTVTATGQTVTVTGQTVTATSQTVTVTGQTVTVSSQIHGRPYHYYSSTD